MKIIPKYFVIFLAIFSFIIIGIFACKKSSPMYITEGDIWEIMDEVEIATLDKDINGVIKHLAPSVVIRVTTNTPLGPQKVQMTREEYKAETLKGWAMTSNNEYRFENEEIKISDDGQIAVVETDVIERYVLQGQTINTTTHERVTLEVVDGEILVTRIDATMSMQSVI